MVTTVTSSTSSATQDLSSYYQEKIENFQNGKTNITKQDLTDMVSSYIKEGEDPPVSLTGMLSAYSQIDTNGDGISYSEFEDYKGSSAGLLSSLGITADSMKNYLAQMDLTLLSGSSSSVSNLLDAGILGSTSSTGSLISSLGLTSTSSSVESLIESYNNGTYSAAESSNYSLLDYLT